MDLVFDFHRWWKLFAFRSQPSETESLTNLTLLRHWRGHGFTNKAYEAAKHCLIQERRALGHWLFAVETAVVHFQDFDTANQIVRRLCKTKAFADYEKYYAAEHFASLAVKLGHKIDADELLREEGAMPARPKRTTAVHQASRLRSEGKFQAAASCLREALKRDPADMAASLQLILVLTEDLCEFTEAERLIKFIATQSFTPPALLEYARATLQENKEHEFQQKLDQIHRGEAAETATPPLEGPVVPPFCDGIVQDMLDANMLGSAIERLEQGLQLYPDDFGGWLRLADIQMNRCNRRGAAEKIERQLKQSPLFTDQQKAEAVQRFRQWRMELMDKPGW